jgi:Tfp pilus assembly protein PilF
MQFAAVILLVFQDPDPAYSALDRAYAALRDRNYDVAVASFRDAARISPLRADIRKNLGYVLLKIGESEAARDQFRNALKLEPGDDHLALEYAFLCYETRQKAEARRIFDRIRKTGNETAEQAFQNIDRPLAEGIARWTRALELDPKNFSAHHELAMLAEQRDELELAAEHYRTAWKLRPGIGSLLIDLGRVLKQMKREEEANAVLLAASRGAEPRSAESGRALLPARYPYVSEFRAALNIDSSNLELRRELAYLLLELNQRIEAEKEFAIVVESSPKDLLSTAQLGFLRLSRLDLDGAMPLLERVLAGADEELAERVRKVLNRPKELKKAPASPGAETSSEARILAGKSLEKGYLKDAVKYLTIAHEADPRDFDVMLKLGWTYNNLKDDREALKWFDFARRSPDPAIKAEASKAYRNLKPAQARVRTTIWSYPLYSTRWHDFFNYSQIKFEIRVGKLPLKPYMSIRFDGDLRGAIKVNFAHPQFLSESSFIFGAGVTTPQWHGLNGWFEGGKSKKYRRQFGEPTTRSDYRGGLAFSKVFGHPLGSRGWFADTTDDGLFLSRFNNDLLLYSQNRAGYGLRPGESIYLQFFWGWNLTADSRSEPWANFVEAGPGIRLRFPGPFVFTAQALQGRYLILEGNPRKPAYYDLRIGMWYAVTR